MLLNVGCSRKILMIGILTERMSIHERLNHCTFESPDLLRLQISRTNVACAKG